MDQGALGRSHACSLATWEGLHSRHSCPAARAALAQLPALGPPPTHLAQAGVEDEGEGEDQGGEGQVELHHVHLRPSYRDVCEERGSAEGDEWATPVRRPDRVGKLMDEGMYLKGGAWVCAPTWPRSLACSCSEKTATECLALQAQ